MRRLFRLVLAFLFSGHAMAQDESNEELNILFVGNSYTHMYEMPFIFDKIAKAKGKNVHVEMNTRSGASFNVHTTRPDLFEAIKSRKWDYVVLQGYSREMTFEPSYLDTATVPYIQQIVDSIRTNNACTKILFQMTWGYKEGFLEREETDSYIKMADVIADGYQYLSDSLSIPIVPVGRVHKEVRALYPEIELYDADKAHPSKNGSYLSACTFYAAIFKESPTGAVTSTIGSDAASKIQKVAGDYVLANFAKYKLNTNFHKIESTISKDGKYVVNGTANFEKAAGITWDFGDGTTSADKSVKHVYKNDGKYKVVLTVQNECGEQKICKTVKFTEPKKPIAKPAKKAIKGNKPNKKN